MMYRNMWANYRQIQWSWLWFFVIIHKKWMYADEADQVKRNRMTQPEGESNGPR